MLNSLFLWRWWSEPSGRNEQFAFRGNLLYIWWTLQENTTHGDEILFETIFVRYYIPLFLSHSPTRVAALLFSTFISMQFHYLLDFYCITIFLEFRIEELKNRQLLKCWKVLKYWVFKPWNPFTEFINQTANSKCKINICHMICIIKRPRAFGSGRFLVLQILLFFRLFSKS